MTANVAPLYRASTGRQISAQTLVPGNLRATVQGSEDYLS